MPDALEDIFCFHAQKYGLEKLLVMSVGMVESAWNPMAYRFEPALWDNYLSKDPNWNTQEPKVVSSSYGIMQLLYTTAYGMGWRGEAEELYDPTTNIDLGCKLLRQLLLGIKTSPNKNLFPIEIALARYNGGFSGNPSPDGKLRNYEYVRRVKAAYWDLRPKYKNCDE
jgi:soluble lytic murein transglycosylase-like protein